MRSTLRKTNAKLKQHTSTKGRDHFRPWWMHTDFLAQSWPTTLEWTHSEHGQGCSQELAGRCTCWGEFPSSPAQTWPALYFVEKKFHRPLRKLVKLLCGYPQPVGLVSQLVKKQAALHKPRLFGDGWESAWLCCSPTGRAAGGMWRCVGNITIVTTATSARCGIYPAVQGTAERVISHWQPLHPLQRRLDSAYTTGFSLLACQSAATENLASHTPGLCLT